MGNCAIMRQKNQLEIVVDGRETSTPQTIQKEMLSSQPSHSIQNFIGTANFNTGNDETSEVGSQNVIYGTTFKKPEDQELNIIQIQKSLTFEDDTFKDEVSGQVTPSLHPRDNQNRKILTFYNRCQPLRERFTREVKDNQITTSLEAAIHTVKIELCNGSFYEGRMSTGKREGYGILQQSDGSRYEGYWKDDVAHGKGTYKTKQGQQYEGMWKDGLTHGVGHLYDPKKKCHYEGQWAEGLMCGMMRQFWDDGSKFEGRYQRDMRNGKGRLEFPDGSYYEGQFKNNFLHGVGKYHWQGRRTYTGNWFQNRMEGHGIMENIDGSIYEGNFVNDKKEGQGTCFWPDGSKYVGMWLKDKQHGIGQLITAEGTVHEGLWMFGKFKQEDK